MKPTTFRDSDIIQGILMAISNQAPGRYFWAGDVVPAVAQHYYRESTIPAEPPGLEFMRRMETGALCIQMITGVDHEMGLMVDDGIISPVGKSKAASAFVRWCSMKEPKKSLNKKKTDNPAKVEPRDDNEIFDFTNVPERDLGRKTFGSTKAYTWGEGMGMGGFYRKSHAIDYHYEPGLRWTGYDERPDVVAFWRLLMEARGAR